jgi:pimeloyl-ACP methyl ester carboxylesterase
LPEEQVKSRSIGRALKFSLYKIARKVFKKQEPDWNQLKAWEFSANDGKFMGYEEEDSAIQAQVKAAKKILLLVHGGIGNTDGMLDFATQLCKAGCYDLVLTFDYENLNTPIADIALYLKLRLVGDAAPHKEVKYDGIGLGENKKIDVLAHSMGGLVVRHFIEMQGGHQYINRLIMCGTPNGGSAFGKIDDYVKFASIGLTIAIGVLSPLKLPLKIAGFIANLRTIKSGVGVTNMLTRTLQDMKPDSTFLRQLNASPSNQVKYDVLAGDIYKYASQSHPNARIIARIYNKLLKWVGSWVYGNAPNDIAVRVKDINLTKAGQTVTNQGVVCHHLNYFSEEDCVELLKRVLCELDATS